MYKVFFDQKQIIITDDKALLSQNEAPVHLFQSKENLNTTIREFINGDKRSALMVFGDCAYDILNVCKSLFEYRIAAGGIVRNENGHILMIKRKGLWDLPKGHMDAGETVLQTAIRETREETGISLLNAGGHFDDTHHLYFIGDKLVLKKSVWFLMDSFSTEVLKPQTEEHITETKWADPVDLPHLFKNTYLSIAELLTSYLKKQNLM